MICVKETDAHDLRAEEEETEIENVIWDGEALLDAEIFNVNGYGMHGMMLLRNRFFKTCAFNTNLQDWFFDNDITQASRLAGYTTSRDIKDIKLVITESGVKYFKFMPKDMPFEQKCKRFLDALYEGKNSSVFGDMYQYHIKNHVKARFKDKPLKDVTTIDLQMIITACPYSRSRVDVYQMLNAAFRVAKQQDVISKNPAEGLISPRHRKVSGMPLTLAEQKAFFKSIENEECKNDYLFYLFSGVRRSELLTINVASLDYENNLIYVHGTKTENAERAIPFTDILKSIISEMTPDENGYFFTHSADWYTKNFKKYSQNHCLRELRKSFITRSGENGVDIKAIQRWVGHADYQTTANIYFKAQDEFLKSNAKKLNDYQTAYWRDVTEDDI